ncbi:hypothetical protein JVU11DRAFT_10879 [Chiua virens]|nr:hypothetical protein JVU11DRAFT_10879 [Chiua virens]
MQQEEIVHMGTIYSRPLFTIIAAAGGHANSSLPGVEKGSCEQAQKTLKLANCEFLTAINVLNPQSGIDDMPWAQRAWTFQERVLSNRLLVFLERQVYWNCRSTSLSEERALEEAWDIDWHRLPFPQQLLDDHLSWEPLQSVEYCHSHWAIIVRTSEHCGNRHEVIGDTFTYTTRHRFDISLDMSEDWRGGHVVGIVWPDKLDGLVS